MQIQAFAAKAVKSPFEPITFDAGPLAPGDVHLRVTHCGICHSDLSMLDNEWGMSAYPLVPGHEVVGVVEAIGSNVSHLRTGQRVGLGWQCAACSHCEWCFRGREHLCASQSATIVGRHGGFASHVRAQAEFAIPIPDAISSDLAGPLMCAGATVFTPLLTHKVTAADRCAVVGIGGLGHLALQFLSKWGCSVTAISSTRSKEAEARDFGASAFIATTEPDALTAAANRFDYIISTISADADWNALVNTLRPQGRLVIVGVPNSPLSLAAFPMISSERTVAGGRLGAPGDIAAMLDFAARTGVRPMIERFKMADVNRAMDRLRSGKARYRVVLESEG